MSRPTDAELHAALDAGVAAHMLEMRATITNLRVGSARAAQAAINHRSWAETHSLRACLGRLDLDVDSPYEDLVAAAKKHQRGWGTLQSLIADVMAGRSV